MDKRARDYALSQRLAKGTSEESRGKGVEIRPCNFRLSLAQKIQGHLGPPAYAVRARRIEDSIEALYEELEAEHEQLAAVCEGDAEGFAEAWTSFIGTVRLDALNALIGDHNRYYPIEANLPDDPEGPGFMFGGQRWEGMDEIGHDSLLERFPPDGSSKPR